VLGIDINGGNRFSISNCMFVGNTDDGIDTTTSACNNYTISGCFFRGNAKAIDTNAADNYRDIHDNICYPYNGDVIDLNAATNSTINLCHNNIAQIVVS
jgi:hypothetical protein